MEMWRLSENYVKLNDFYLNKQYWRLVFNKNKHFE